MEDEFEDVEAFDTKVIDEARLLVRRGVYRGTKCNKLLVYLNVLASVIVQMGNDRVAGEEKLKLAEARLFWMGVKSSGGDWWKR